MKATIKRRNMSAMSPLMRKGGAHSKSRSSQRRGQQQALHDELAQWHDEYSENSAQEERSDDRSFLCAA